MNRKSDDQGIPCTHQYALPESTIAPETGPSQKDITSSNFQGRTVSLREGVPSTRLSHFAPRLDAARCKTRRCHLHRRPQAGCLRCAAAKDLSAGRTIAQPPRSCTKEALPIRITWRLPCSKCESSIQPWCFFWSIV